ncbi:MAG: VWA domain-containing protein, partial [Firmicutes bacterium]|nr:VWA domain-containing protein [Bacillota bacterium]
MAKRERKNVGRRSLALFLTLVLMISSVQITAFGASYPDQVMKGSYIVDENGNAIHTEETMVEEDGFKLWKTIEQTGLNEFDITLKVQTSETVISNDAAIQLVIDTSSSMQYCATCGGHKGNGFGVRCNDRNHTENRLDAIKEILAAENGFLDDLAVANTGRVLVSVVTYGEGANTRHEWVNIKEKANLAAVKATINNLSAPDNATNMHAGLMLANNRLDMSAIANAAVKYTVLLSDGFANCVGKESNSTTSISLSGRMPSDSNPTSEGTRKATAMAAEVAKKSTVYAVGYGVDEEYLSDIIGSEDNVFVGTDSESISEVFSHIADSAVEGMSGAGTKVIDPMGQFIVLNAEGLEGAIANGNGLEWNLDPSKAEISWNDDNTVKTYTYEITYPITLNTAAPGFEEFEEDGSVKYYPTNGYTYLNVPQDNGSVKKIAFLVPGVNGEIPELDWTVEYYLQDEESLGSAPTYTLDKSKDMGLADLHSSVYAPDFEDEEYKNEYADDDYVYAGGNPIMVIREENNVMKLYYNIISAKVYENHYYKTDKILADGTEVISEYAETADKSYEKDVKINTEYSAEPELEYGNAMYELDFTNPENNQITVYKDGENKIDLFYTRLIDERATTSAIVKHVYTTYGYELNEDDKYELVELGSQEEVAEQASELKATTMFDVSAEPLEDYSDFELNPALGDYEDMLQEDGTLSFKVAEDPEDNVRTLYFETVIDNRERIDITVNHYYTKTIVSYEDGEEVISYEPNGIKGHSEEDIAYKGESYTAYEIYSYDGDIYEADAGNADKLYIESLESEVVIDLYYNLVVRPEKTELIVDHTWRTFTEVTREITEEYFDEATSSTAIRVIGTETETIVTEDHYIDGSENPVELFIGEGYTAPKEVWGEGYEYNEEESKRYGIGGEDAYLELFYDKYEEQDDREEAAIDVLHKYYTYVTSIIDGEIETVKVTDGIEEEAYDEYKAGDEFTAVAVPNYKDNEYVQITDESDLGPVILQPGTNATIVIEYERETNALVDTEYVVNYEYRTYDMNIGEDGVAVYGEPTIETVTGEAISGYVGEKVVLDPGSRAGFTPLSDNPGLEHFLAADGNEWTFVHEKYNDLAKVPVSVNHHYTTVTIAENGTSSSESFSVKEAEVEVYAGESFRAEAVLNGFDLVALGINSAEVEAKAEVTVTVEGKTVIDFYYTKTVDNSVPVNYSIEHVYNYYDWDGSLIVSSVADPITTGTGYLGTPITATPEPNGYALVDAEFDGADLDIAKAEHTVILTEGENKIVFTYELHKERDKVDVRVIHNYYQNEEALNAEDGEPLEKVELTETEVYEEESYTAELLEKDGFKFHSANP